MKTALRLILWSFLVVLFLPTAVGALLAGCLIRVFDDNFTKYDGWGFFLAPLKFIRDKFPMKGSK